MDHSRRKRYSDKLDSLIRRTIAVPWESFKMSRCSVSWSNPSICPFPATMSNLFVGWSRGHRNLVRVHKSVNVRERGRQRVGSRGWNENTDDAKG